MSLYLTVSGDGSYRILGEESRLERVPIRRNLRYPAIDSQFSVENIATGQLDFEFGPELCFVRAGGPALQVQSWQARARAGRLHFSFVDGKLH